MGRKNIRKFSALYEIVLFLGTLYHKVYYRRFRSVGKENIPWGAPVIFAANHQNALMDALAVLFATRKQFVFLARADIFSKKFFAALLYFLKILPVYRVRDGLRSVEENLEVFDEVVAVLKHGRPLGILPEGNHLGMKRLRPLKKGPARLAFQAEEANGFRLGLHIVPVGLDYSNYFNAGSELLVVFGKPIAARDYEEHYRKNPAQAMVKLTEDLRAEMLRLMIHIPSEEYYSTFYLASEMMEETVKHSIRAHPPLYRRFLARKSVVERLDQELTRGNAQLPELKAAVEEYSALLKKFRLRDFVIRKRRASWAFTGQALLMLALLPLHLYGMVLNWIPYAIPIRLARNIKDRHFLGSIRFGTGFLLHHVWYILIAIALCFVPAPFIYKLIFFLTGPLTGVFSFYYYRHLLKMAGKFRWIRLKMNKKKESDHIVQLRKDIIGLLRKILGDGVPGN